MLTVEINILLYANGKLYAAGILEFELNDRTYCCSLSRIGRSAKIRKICIGRLINIYGVSRQSSDSGGSGN